MYNRTPSYDAILQQLGVDLDHSADGGAPLGNTSSWDEGGSQSPQLREKEGNDPHKDGAVAPDVAHEQGGKVGKTKMKVATDWLREALPIDIRCKIGAIVMGNPSTANIVIAAFDSVDGTYAAVKVSGISRKSTRWLN